MYTKIKERLQVTLKKNELTPETYKTNYAVALPTIVFSALTFASTQIQVSIPNSESVIQVAKSTALKGTAITTLTKIILGVGVTSIASVGIIMLNPRVLYEVSAMPKIDLVIKEEPCKIEAIEYNTGYTKESVLLTITLSNQDYDQILVNDIETLYVHENGEYVVKVMKGEVVLEERSISITNIDKESPQYLDYSVDGSNYIIYLNDSISGIDGNSISYMKNGKINNDFRYDSNTQSIIFTYSEYTSNVFRIQDRAGNSVKVIAISEQEYLKGK